MRPPPAALLLAGGGGAQPEGHRLAWRCRGSPRWQSRGVGLAESGDTSGRLGQDRQALRSLRRTMNLNEKTRIRAETGGDVDWVTGQAVRSPRQQDPTDAITSPVIYPLERGAYRALTVRRPRRPGRPGRGG